MPANSKCLMILMLFLCGIGFGLIYYFFGTFVQFIELISYVTISAGFNIIAALTIFTRVTE